MGANMQRQAVPLLRATAPFIGTGVEARAARDAGDLALAQGEGKGVDVDGTSITGGCTTGPKKKVTHRLDKFRRSNQGTCINQKPLVNIGDSVTEGDVPSDRPSTASAELALGDD